MPTLSTTQLLHKTMKAFRVQAPMLAAMGTDFGSDPLYKDQQVIARIRVLPTAADYDLSTGYANGATSGRNLLVDVPLTIDKHRHVPIKFEHINNITDQISVHEGAVEDAGFVLGREMVTSVLEKVRARNITGEKAVASASIDYDDISDINGEMNKAGASPIGRIGIVNTDVANSLDQDTRIASRDFYGQLTGGGGYRVFRNVGGFSAIYEYPDLPNNNAAGKTFTRSSGNVLSATAHGYLTGDRVRVSTSAADLPDGLAIDTNYYVIKLSDDTFSLASSYANAIAGTAVTVSDAGTGTHTVTGYENLTGFFFESAAVAIKAGIPNHTAALAGQLGVPQIIAMEALKDPASGFSLALMKFQAPNADLYVSPSALWGSSVGKQGGTSLSKTDRAGFRLVSAA